MPWRKSHLNKLSNKSHYDAFLMFPLCSLERLIFLPATADDTIPTWGLCVFSLSSATFCVFLDWCPWAASPHTSSLFPQLTLHSIAPSHTEYLEAWGSKELFAISCFAISSYLYGKYYGEVKKMLIKISVFDAPRREGRWPSRHRPQFCTIFWPLSLGKFAPCPPAEQYKA